MQATVVQVVTIIKDRMVHAVTDRLVVHHLLDGVVHMRMDVDVVIVVVPNDILVTVLKHNDERGMLLWMQWHVVNLLQVHLMKHRRLIVHYQTAVTLVHI